MISGRLIASQKLNEAPKNSINKEEVKESSNCIDDEMWENIKSAVQNNDRDLVHNIMNPSKSMKQINSEVEADVKELSKRSNSMQG